MKRKLAIGVGAALALTAVGGAPAMADNHESTVSVLHAVPGLTVDVFINGEEAIPDFQPGTLTDPMMLAAGSYDIQVFADGGTDALLHKRWPRSLYVPKPVMGLAMKAMPLVAKVQRRRQGQGTSG